MMRRIFCLKITSSYPYRFKFLLFSLIMAVSASVSASAGCDKKTLIHGWGGDWVPFVLGTPDKPSGLDMEILDAIIKKAGCQWRNTPHAVPWARHLKQIESGELDLATAASWTEERARYAYFTHAYRSEFVALYVLKKHYDAYSALSLSQLSKVRFRLGAVRGEVYGEKMGKFVAELGSKVYHVESNEQNIQKMKLDRIDGYIGHVPHDSIFLNKHGLSDDIVLLPISVQPTGDIHIMMSKKSTSENDLKALNEAIQALEQDGTIAAIKKKYSSQFKADIF